MVGFIISFFILLICKYSAIPACTVAWDKLKVRMWATLLLIFQSLELEIYSEH